jgi:hypothetical protein
MRSPKIGAGVASTATISGVRLQGKMFSRRRPRFTAFFWCDSRETFACEDSFGRCFCARRGNAASTGGRAPADRRHGHVRATARAVDHGSVYATFAETDGDEAHRRRGRRARSLVRCAILEVPPGFAVLLDRFVPILHSELSHVRLPEHGARAGSIAQAIGFRFAIEAGRRLSKLRISGSSL